MEIACRKCSAVLSVASTAIPIVKCSNCGYPNPVIAGAQPAPARPQMPAPVTPHQQMAVPPVPSSPPPAPQPPRPTAGRPQASASELGWLVVHDENADQQTHPLRIGKQVIGRKSVSRPCDIMIETDDPYMGRNHCVLEVKPSRTGSYEFFLSDVKMTNGIPEQMSTNGTFINSQAAPLRPKDMVYLKDGDTIQMGKTKVVIKTLITAASAQDASRIVQDMDYAPTVIIK
ncbi:FHA domain-containing protein [Dyadobacter aurulentus]|uniref:FHA domain-containing protein n=1 Tax=Dyadobacter sp. UC 10 TaxID=2605428 RepID=UPI0011F3D33D|nr:FHA domain-containing protein [Dyadobacter sp. UC 10]KAA0989253.1 FHA domain-containing protein [Dyadobacter sp. UC 10]